MPVSVVVGGQYGSEGKGKVSLSLKRSSNFSFAVRPGGTNSGHTGYDLRGNKMVLRQFPAAAIDADICVVFPAGSYIDPDIFFFELRALGLSDSEVLIDPRAHIISAEHRRAELTSGLVSNIGSTGSGTGASVMSRIARYGKGLPKGSPVEEHTAFAPFIRDVPAILSSALAQGRRVLIEGTQGFGLSPLHGASWPKATSRDTTASGFLSEAGLPPMVVSEVVLVLRCYPIRVAGDSGPLLDEITWDELTASSGSPVTLREQTSVTGKTRRIGKFDAHLVQRAIAANGPTQIVLNHLDYVDAKLHGRTCLSQKARTFISYVEDSIGQPIHAVGTGPETMVPLRVADRTGGDSCLTG